MTVADRARRLSTDERTIAKQCLLDWLGVALCGAREPVARRVQAAIVSSGEAHGPATVIGTPLSTGAADAALLNGIAGHILDYDDTSVGPFEGHPSAPLLPALLALAETRRFPAPRLIEAFAVGHQTGSLLGSWMNPAHYRSGWHATATIGVFAAAAGCASALALDADQMRSALALAATHAAGLRVAFGTPAKAVQVGHAAADGLRCALMAEHGVTVEADVLGGKLGFLALHGAREDGVAPTGLDSILVKYHACCHSTHAAVDAAAALGVDPARLCAVEVHAARTLVDVCGIDDPRTGLEFKFSLRGLTTLALLGVDTGAPEVLTDAWADDPRYRELRERVRVRFVNGLSEFEARVTAHVTGGQVLRRSADACRQPAPDKRWPRLIAKFRRLSVPLVGASRAESIVERVRALETLTDAAALLDDCTVRA